MSGSVWCSVFLIVVATVSSSNGRTEKITQNTTLSNTLQKPIVSSVQGHITTIRKNTSTRAQGPRTDLPDRMSQYCRVLENLTTSCGRHQTDWDPNLCYQLTKVCSDREMLKGFQTRGKQVAGLLNSLCTSIIGGLTGECPEPLVVRDIARLADTMTVKGRIMMARYTVPTCHSDESPCGTLISRCTDTGNWTMVEGICCQSTFRLRQLISMHAGSSEMSIEIPWGFPPQTQLVISGMQLGLYDVKQIAFNLRNKTDIIIHVGLRFNLYGESRIIVIDRRLGGYWRGAQKIRHRFPFRTGRAFSVQIEAMKNRFEVREMVSNLTLGSQDYDGVDGSGVTRVTIAGKVKINHCVIKPFVGFPNHKVP